MKKFIKKLVVSSLWLLVVLLPTTHYPLPTAQALTPQDVFGQVSPPPPVAVAGTGAAGIKNILSVIIRTIYVVTGVIFLFMFVWGAFQMVTSGGDKENVAGARKRITYAIIGMVLLAVAFLIVRVFGTILNFNFFG